MVKQSCDSTKDRSAAWCRRPQRARPGLRGALELGDVALADRQEVVDLHGGLEADRLAHGACGLFVRQHQRRGAIRDQRTIGPLQRRCNVRVFLADGAAEVVAEVLAHLRERVVHAVLVVLRRDRRQGIGLVAVALEICLGDAAEHAGKTGGNVGLFLLVAGLEQGVADLLAGRRGHLLDPDHQGEAAAAGQQEVPRAINRGRAGGAGVLVAGDRLEAQFRHMLQHQRCRKILRREAVVEQADEGSVDVVRGNAGILDRGAGDAADQATRYRGLPACRTANVPIRRCRLRSFEVSRSVDLR